jgi:hypothetical protein
MTSLKCASRQNGLAIKVIDLLGLNDFQDNNKA